MNTDGLVLALEVFPPLVTKGTALEEEFDQNNIKIYQDFLAKAEAGGLDAYDNGTTYQLTQAVTYNGRTWVYVNATPADGIQPGTDITYWVEIDPTVLVHRRNSDTKLAEFTADEVSAADLKALVTNRVRVTKVFNKTEANDFLQSGYYDAYVVYAGVAAKGYRLLNPPVMVIDDDGTQFTFSSGESINLINSNNEVIGSFGDPSVTIPGVSKSQGQFFQSYQIVDGSDIRVLSTFAVGGGGAGATITFILDIEVFDF